MAHGCVRLYPGNAAKLFSLKATPVSRARSATPMSRMVFSSSEWFDCASELPIDGGSSVRATAN